jgi:predicted amidohydrolase YtcJ
MPADAAELVLHNGTVYTLSDARPRAQALACRQGRLIAVGTDAEAMALRGPRTRCVDLVGRAVLPGFIDSHIHFCDWALARRQLDLRDTRGPDEVAERVRLGVAAQAPGTWILGGGFDPNLWPADRPPHRTQLDAVAGDHPVLLSSKDLHSCWASTGALQRAGLLAPVTDPPGGRIERDPSGDPTGIVRERAMDPLWRQVPAPSVDEADAAVEEGLPLAWAAGLTGVHEILDTPEALALRTWQRRRRRDGGPGLRVYQHFPVERLQSALELGVESGLGDEWLRLAGVKLFADGALGSRTAHLLEPYRGTDQRGVPVLSGSELRELLGRAHGGGIAASVHAIGDAAVRAVLDAFEAVTAGGTSRGPRHRVEHVQLLAADDLPRFRRLGLIASMQPIHAVSDRVMAEEHWGAGRCQLAYAWRSVLESGAHLCFGSDAPVESLSVLDGLRAAVTRCRDDGSPGPQGWIPEQRISVEQAVRAYTVEPAFASAEERLKGTLEPGKLADAVVLSHDLMADPEAIAEARIELTILDGELVYER